MVHNGHIFRERGLFLVDDVITVSVTVQLQGSH